MLGTVSTKAMKLDLRSLYHAEALVVAFRTSSKERNCMTDLRKNEQLECRGFMSGQSGNQSRTSKYETVICDQVITGSCFKVKTKNIWAEKNPKPPLTIDRMAKKDSQYLA